MYGNRQRTPIPKRENERKATQRSPVVSYYVSPEEMEKMVSTKTNPPNTMTSKQKQELEKLKAELKQAKAEVNTLKGQIEEQGQKSEKAKPITEARENQVGEILCMDAIESAVKGLTGMEAYCAGNAIHHIWQWKDQGGVSELRKCAGYVGRLITVEERKPNANETA